MKKIKDTEFFLKTTIFPHLNGLDSDESLMRRLFQLFKKSGIYRGLFSSESGGDAFGLSERMEYQELMGRYGGALGFLQSQMAAPISLIEKSDNDYVKVNFLPKMLNGDISVGNSLSQLRRGGSVHLHSKKCNGGYFLSGKVAFASGFGLFDMILIGAISDDGMEQCMLLPFANDPVGGMIIGQILDTATMRSLSTVSVDFDQYFVPHHFFIVDAQRYSFYDQAMKRASVFSYPLGTGLAALDIVKNISKKSDNTWDDSIEYFVERIRNLRDRVRDPDSNPEQFVLYADVMDIGWKCVQFAVMVASGSGLICSHSAQRLYREMLIWAIARNHPEITKGFIEISKEARECQNV